MTVNIQKNEGSWKPRQNTIIFADEDVDGITSAAIVGRRYESIDLIFVNARTLSEKLTKFLSTIDSKENLDTIDVFIVDVGINKANVESISTSISILNKKNIRIFYFDTHSNKYKGQSLLNNLEKANAHVYVGKIGTAAASILQSFLGTEETKRLRLLGALSDREIKLTIRYKSIKKELRALQAAVAWGAYMDIPFLEKITRQLIKNPNMDLEGNRDILAYAIKANNHRDKLLRHVFMKGHVISISETPRILAVIVLDRNDFGKARGTIAGRLAGEWSAAILFITQSTVNDDCYAVTIRNSYHYKIDLETLGQLSKTRNSGGSKGAYRLTIKKDNLLIFLAQVQEWSHKLSPPWLTRKKMKPVKYKVSKRDKNRTSKKTLTKKNNTESREMSDKEFDPIVDIIDME